MAKTMEASPPLFPLLLLLTLLACHHHRVARGYKFCGVDVDDAADAVRGYALVCRNDDDDDDDDDDDEEGGWGGRRTMTGPTHGCFYIYMLSIICAFRWDGGYISNGRLIVSSFTLFHSPRLVTFHHPLAALPPMYVFPSIHQSIHPSFFQKCWQPCTTDADCCSSSQECHDVPGSSSNSNANCDSSHSDLSDPVHNYCGTGWCDASYECGTPCPDGTDDECDHVNTGKRCYADTPCGSTRTTPILPPPDRSSAFRYCGTSSDDASANCWQPCPRGNDDECCFGLTCHDTTESSSSSTCPSSIDRYYGSDRYYCGTTWCDAAYDCAISCPGGTDGECPTDMRCYADVPCDDDDDDDRIIGRRIVLDVLRHESRGCVGTVLAALSG